MAFEWDPTQRSAFDEALIAHLADVFPEASFNWTESERRLLVTFSDGHTCTLWEPNFFFSYPSYTIESLFDLAVRAIAGQLQTLQRGEVI